MSMANSDKPLMIELYAGLHGWGEGALPEGYRVIGFDIADMGALLGRPRPDEISLVLQDVTTLHGCQFKDATVIVASPPCIEYSYMAMPWKRSKQIARALRGKGEFPEGYTGSRTIAELNRLFDACFRIQREASEAAGHHIPMIVENVRGAQPWVGKARAWFGSYYLFGDVGMVGKRVVAGVPRFGVSVQPMRHGGAKAPPGNASSPLWKDRAISRTGAHATPEEADALAAWVEERDGTKVPGLDNGCWPPGGLAQGFLDAQKRNPDGTEHMQQEGLKMGWDNTERGKCRRDDSSKVPGISFSGFGEPGYKPQGFNVTAAQRYREEQEQGGSKRISIGSASWHAQKGQPRNPNDPRNYFSKSNARKAASAEIARIPFALASYIARAFRPE
jgi:hypothetical protein